MDAVWAESRKVKNGTMSEASQKQLAYQQDVTNLETAITAIEANRTILGDLAADTALDLLREKLATLIQPNTAADERKRVTVLFADVQGYTALSENLDPEDVANTMNRLFEAVTVEIHRYGGTIDKYAGDAVMALFGAPQALENHEEMAVRASLGMQRVITDFSAQLKHERGFELKMRIGLNTGQVLAGLVGGLQTRSYTVMGDTVNLAARLETAASVGGILASEHTARRLHNIFDFSPPEKIQVKGKSGDITVYQVVGEKSQRGRVRGLEGLQSPMIGREAELGQLTDTFRQALMANKWAATAVVGDAGLGKSRLQQELVSWVLDNHPQVRLLASRCFNHTRTTPYHFIAELLRGLFSLSRDSDRDTAVNHLTAGLEVLQPSITTAELQYQLGSLASIMGFVLPNDPLQNLEPEQRRDRTFLSLERIFLAAAHMKPLLVLIDDLHWADALSLDFLKRILQIITGDDSQSGAAMFLIISRPAEDRESDLNHILQQLADAPFTTVRVTALNSSQAETLIEQLLDQQIAPDLRRLIIDHAQGNPFYVEEVLRALIEDGTLKKNGTWNITQDIADISIPPSVQDLLAARIDRLPPADKRITQHAAIIGRIFWQDVLHRITIADTVEPTLLLLELRQLADRMQESQLTEDWEWVFHHGLIQEVAYASVTRAARRTIHREVAQILEERLGEQTAFLIPLIADHYEQGEVVDKAIQYLGHAGEQAAAQFANQDAISYFSRALKLLDKVESTLFLSGKQLDQKYHLLLGRVGVYHIIGRRPAQKSDLEKLAFIADRIGNKAYQATSALHHARYYEAISDFPSAVQFSQTAVSFAEAGDNLTQKVDGLTAWAFGLIRQGAFEEAQSHLDNAQQISHTAVYPAGEATSLLYSGMVQFFYGDLVAAKGFYERSLQLFQRNSDVQRQMACLNNLVGVYHGLGDIGKAKDVCEEALHISQTIGNRANEATILNNLAAIHHALGSLDNAKQYNEEALMLSQAVNDKRSESLAANNLGLVLYDLGMNELANGYAQQALAIDREIGDKSGEGYSLTTFALTLEGLGDLEQAQKHHADAIKLRREIGQDACAIDNVAGLARLNLLQSRLDEALVHANEALAWLDSKGSAGIEYPLKAYLVIARVLIAMDNPQRALAVLETAVSLINDQAEQISDPQSRQSFIQHVPVHQELKAQLKHLLSHKA